MKSFEKGMAPYLVVALVALVLAAASLVLYLGDRPPREDSAAAGFARDMTVHHAQAVEMSGIVNRRTENQDVRTMTTDIVLTQQAQIGQMRGWLDVWNLPATGLAPPMSWMGHEGPMPGMASPEEINRLRELPPDEMDRLFLRLMIEHHEGAIPMSEAALERSDRQVVGRLAGSIISSQQAEIELMQNMLGEMGGTGSA